MFKIVCSFDAMIAETDVVEALLTEFALPQWRDIEREWLEGRIDNSERRSRQTALVRAQRHQLTRLIHSVVIDSTFPSFAAFCTARNLEIVVVSGGFDILIRQVLTRHCVGHLSVIANRLRQITADRWQMGFPYQSQYCETDSGLCTCKAIHRGDKPVLFIGSGLSEICFARRADLVFAKGHLADYCRTRRLPHLEIHSFADALLILEQLLAPELDDALQYH
ncbi:MAG: 2,3-diketo-5-methylthio-1-phosphopentane phosphatase [Candidatus Binatia bacterium]